jgi:hypothetical protein
MMRSFLLMLCLPFAGFSQDSVAPVVIRAAYHNPVKPLAEFFIADPSGAIVPLNLVSEMISYPQITVPVNGNLVIYKQKMVDPKNPQAAVAASAKIPADWKKVIVLIFPSAAEGDQSAYRMLLINDAANVFKKGESRVVNLTQAETALQAGEHKIPLPSGKVTELPAVKQVNEFNMAQTNFFYKEADQWVPFTERQLQFLDSTKRIFLVYLTPGSTQPFVTTLVDNTPVQIPQANP